MKDVRLIYGSLFTSPLTYLQFITGIEIDHASLNYYYQHFLSINYIDFNKTFNDPLLFLRFNAFLCLFTFGYYYVQVIFMCFLSLIGLTALYKSAIQIAKCNEWFLFFACFGIPSVMAWGSSILKEPLILFLLGSIIWNFYQWITDKKVLKLFLFILCGICLFLIIFQ